MVNVVCLHLVNICLIFSILYMLYRLVMAGRTPGSGRGRGRPRKHGLPPRTYVPPTTSTAPVSTTPVSDASSFPLDLDTQKFVMIKVLKIEPNKVLIQRFIESTGLIGVQPKSIYIYTKIISQCK